MKQKLFLTLAGILVLALGGQFSSPIQRTSLQNEILQLQQQGVSVRFLDNTTAEVSDPASGLKRVKTLQEPSEAEIRAWAAARGVPILEIDPRTLDTNRWRGWYRYWTQVPLSNDIGEPLVVGDLDRNNKPEVYGTYKDYRSDFETHIYELDSSGTYLRVFNYVPRLGAPIQFVNPNSDSLIELMFAQRGGQDFYSQPTVGALPVQFSFQFQRDSSNTSGGFQPAFGLMDGDALEDMVYIGTTSDSMGQPISHIDVAEFSFQQNNFVRVWYSRFGQSHFVNFGNPTFGDYDHDGFVEIEACEMNGKIFVAENRGNNVYVQTWTDTTGFVNLYYETFGDIDDDGKREFYTGATMCNGNWTTMYEADSNDHYSPKFIFHLLSGGSLDEPTYLTPDVDHDGRNELAILSGADLYVFKSNANDSYYLWYFKRFSARHSIQFYDFNSDGKDDIMLSLGRQDSLFRLSLFSEIYLAQRLTAVGNTQNEASANVIMRSYPNPFNASTRIEFDLGVAASIQLEVYSVEGKHVRTILSGTKNEGHHFVEWDGTTEDSAPAASGLYLCRLRMGSEIHTLRLLLLR